jgi:hypothetical protein
MDIMVVFFVALAWVMLCTLIMMAWACVWCYREASRRLRAWAVLNGYGILRKQLRLFRRGPFFWWPGLLVYRLTVRDAEGRVRGCYVRVGGWFPGMLSDKVTVKWDAEGR